MQVSIDHVLFWMDAIRNSDNRYRTLESFWKGQVQSKIWLIENIAPWVLSIPNNIVIHGGWNGVLASLLFQTGIQINRIVSIDIDTSCEETAKTMNKIEEIEGRFKAVTCNMADYEYEFYPDLVINTSCEHITQETYNKWLEKIPKKTIIILQSNDYFELSEHIRCATNIKDFENQSNINIINSSVLELSKYNRFMIIGYKK
jgi:hypothetical protein